VQQDGNSNHYVFGFPAEGPPSYDYSLCWSRFGYRRPAGLTPLEELTMDANGLFAARIGSFIIAGPHRKNFACTMGVPCVMDLPGVALERTNALAIISAGLCGKSNSRIESHFVGIPNPVKAGPDPYKYEAGTIVDGRPTADGFSVCWGYDPVSKWHYTLTVGYMNMNGPGRGGMLTSQAGHLKCPRGRSCTSEFKGIGLSTTNGVAVFNHGDPRIPCSGELATSGDFGFEHNPALSELANVGEYRMGVVSDNFACPRNKQYCQLWLCWAHEAPAVTGGDGERRAVINGPEDLAKFNVPIGYVTVLPYQR
jgi:hypothetical protein